MEYIQAFLFTSEYLLGRSGNTDLFYLFAIFALFFYMLKRKDKFLLVCKIVAPVGMICFTMSVFCSWTLPVRCLVFFAKTTLNVSLMVYVAYNCKKWKKHRFIHLFVLIHGIETFCALIFRNSSLWIQDFNADGQAVSRLCLFYKDPGSMAFACGLVLILLVYELLTGEVIWKQVAGIVVMLVDLFYSYGMGGICCVFTSRLNNVLHGTVTNVWAILPVLVCMIGLGYYCVKYGTTIDRALYLYIIIYQMTGGHFTDPANFFVYGWILGDCLYRKVEQTGTCRISMFLPVRKEHLKIAMIGHKRIPGREGGVEIVVEELAKRMVCRGHQVDAYNRSGNHVSGAEYNAVDYDTLKEYEGIHIVKIPTIPRKGIAAFVYSLLASLYVVTKDYDVVHYHAEGPCLFMWIPSLFGMRTVCTIHGLDWRRSGKWGSLVSRVIKTGEKMAVLFSDEMIVLSHHCKQYFLDTYNRETNLIPNGVIRPVHKNAQVINEKWGLTQNSYFLTLARLTKEKRTDLLIEAFREVKTEKKLVISGGSSDSDAYVMRLKELAKPDDRIIFTGFVQEQELEELYSNAYVYVLPSELEGMSLSLLEAMSYGNCCLTSDIPDNTEVTGKMGITFATNDKGELIRALQELVDKPENVSRYKAGAADYVCSKFRWEDVVEKTIALYQEK